MNHVTETEAMIDAEPVFDENEAAVIDAFVVPAYLRLFWEASRDMLLVGEASRVAHLGSLTGYPGSELLEKMPNTTGVGVERSEACATLAAQKLQPELFSYLVGDPANTGLPEHTFSHSIILHPAGGADQRRRIFTEAARLLYQGGQALVALPLSRSFPEVLDLISEFGLKYDDAAISKALEEAASDRVTVESISDELEQAGFSDIDFEVHNDVVGYDSGRAFLEDPAVRYFIAPQVESWLDQLDLAAAMDYVGRAIDKYWSEDRMEMNVSVAAFSARR
jgi:ubiquinone/menaquinone biosynthesis C-methylase UbiE